MIAPSAPRRMPQRIAMNRVIGPEHANLLKKLQVAAENKWHENRHRNPTRLAADPHRCHRRRDARPSLGDEFCLTRGQRG